MSDDYNTPFSLYEGELVAGGNPQCGDVGGTKFFGLLMGQNQHALVSFDKLFKCLEKQGAPVARVIELGTSTGGMSIYLQLYCHVAGASFVTYDLLGKQPTYSELFDRLGIDYRQRDVLSESAIHEIRDLIRGDGISVLLCDNGDKSREFSAFASALKTGDIILAHDYAPDREYFDKHMRDRTWSSLYVVASEIATVCEEQGLAPYLEKDFLRAAWVCKRKAA